MLSPEQCRGARAMLNISREALAERAQVSARTVAEFERGARQPIPLILNAFRRALEDAGIEFIDGNGGGAGVRMRDSVKT